MLQEASGAAGHPSYRRYHYGSGPLLVEDGGVQRFISTDALGSTTDLTTTGATVASMRKYDAWGQYRSGTAPLPGEAKLGFTGHQYDPETGLVYARARYYDPDLGRFVSRDSYEGSLSEAPSLHRYSYVLNNPVRYTDPTGHEISTCTTQTGAPQCATAAGEAAGGTGTAAGTGAAGEGAGVTSRTLVEAAKEAQRIKAAAAAARAAAEAAKKPAWWKAAAASLIAAILAETPKDMTPEEARRAADEEARRITATTQQLVGKDVKVVAEGTDGGTVPVPISDPGDHRPITAPGDDGSAARVITDPSSGAPMVAPGTGDAPVSAPAPEGRDTPLHLAGSGSAQIVYDGNTGRYRDTQTGRFIAQRDLPWPANNGFASSRTGLVPVGTVIDRFGRPSGRYAGEPGSTLSERGLAQGSDALGYHQYEVVKPIPAEIGPAAPVRAFGAKGGGTQYYFQRSIADLIRSGHLREVP